MKLKQGDMVKANAAICGDFIELMKDPPVVITVTGRTDPYEDRVTGFMTDSDVAIVIDIDTRATCCYAYVLGPNGSGWTYTALLICVKKPAVTPNP